MKRTQKDLIAAAEAPNWLSLTANIIYYDPFAEKSYTVRLPGFGKNESDGRNLKDKENPTKDAVGVGKTLGEAAEDAKWKQTMQSNRDFWRLIYHHSGLNQE